MTHKRLNNNVVAKLFHFYIQNLVQKVCKKNSNFQKCDAIFSELARRPISGSRGLPPPWTPFLLGGSAPQTPRAGPWGRAK